MTTPFTDRLAALVAERGPLCVGVDPHPGLVAEWGLPDDASGLRSFALRVLDAAAERVAVIKPQVAFFERHGAEGFAVLAELLAAARDAGVLTIADAKRGDIGSTVAGYADAWLDPASSLAADAVTAVAYQGVGSLAPMLDAAARHGGAVFVLGATSNPEAPAIQTAVRADGMTVARSIVDELRSRAAAAPGSLGVVLGATVDLQDAGIDAAATEGLVILAPGFGTQGARLGDLHTLYGAAAPRVLASVSRSVLGAGPDGLERTIDAARAEVAA